MVLLRKRTDAPVVIIFDSLLGCYLQLAIVIFFVDFALVKLLVAVANLQHRTAVDPRIPVQSGSGPARGGAGMGWDMYDVDMPPYSHTWSLPVCRGVLP